MCAMAQQLSGINNVFNFSSTFLSQNGIGAETVSLVAEWPHAAELPIDAVELESCVCASRWTCWNAGAIGLYLATSIVKAVR